MPELDAILGVKIPVLDDGFVRVVDYMGDDAAIVQAAIQCAYGAGTKTRSGNAIYIRYLMQRRITKPFETVPDKAPFPHAHGLLESVDQPRDRRGAPGLPDSCLRRDLLDHRPAQPVPLPGHPRPTATLEARSLRLRHGHRSARSWCAGCRRRIVRSATTAWIP